jgi:hypothetical protein
VDLCQNGSWQPCQNIDYLINPDYGTEICDDVDNDCDADTDGGCDDDSDGWCDADLGHSGSPGICTNGFDDCDDTDPLVHPGAGENCVTAHDDNCDGQSNDLDAIGCTNFYRDGDGDGLTTWMRSAAPTSTGTGTETASAPPKFSAAAVPRATTPRNSPATAWTPTPR